jgi:hypothetical protein
VRKTVSVTQAATTREDVLPPRVQEALGELVGAAREGLLALSVGVGLGVVSELMEEEVCEAVGPKASTTPIAARCATATRPARLRLAAGVSPWSAHGPERQTAAARSSFRPTRTSLTATR